MPGTTCVQVSSSAAPLVGTSTPVAGVALVADADIYIGLTSGITADTAATAGMKVAAGTYFEVPPAFWGFLVTPDLHTLYAITGGSANVWLMYL